jgi:hypothetical protein
MKGLLIRIGVDHAYGCWNAPVDPTSNEFVYLPIPERIGTTFHPDLECRYSEFMPAVEKFCMDRGVSAQDDLGFPPALMNHPVHLDPDFSELTYGDDGGRRGTGIKAMTEGVLLCRAEAHDGMRSTNCCTLWLAFI